MRPRAVFVGPPGAGKTTVGAAVAQTLGLPFRDTDHLIVATAGKSAPDIFFDHGEAHFRALECATIADCLAGFDGVLALGGGAVLAEQTRVALRGHQVVFLSVELPDALRRVGMAGGSRPLLAINPRARLKQLLDERRPIYQQVAVHTVRTDGRTVDDIVTEVVKLVS